MSINIHSYTINAQLSLSAYADFDGLTDIGDIVNELEVAGMIEDQARAFLGVNENNNPIGEIGYEIIHHQPNDSSGFSATIFRNRETGDYHLAIRGTEGPLAPLDIINDVNAVFTGGAVNQILSLLNYYQRLITSAGGAAIQVSHVSGAFIPSTAEGLGVLEPDIPLNVTGHSLGGHLVDAFVKAFPSIGGTATQGFTYNGLGVGPAIDDLLDQVSELYGITPDTTSPNSEFHVTNLIAEPGRDIVPNALAASNQLGDTEFLFIEEGFGPQNHSISRLADALAVYDLFATIDNSLTTDAISQILYAATNEAGTSLERMVTSLGTLIDPIVGEENQLGEDVTIPTGDRENLYSNIAAIRNNFIDGAALAEVDFNIINLRDLSPQAYFETARTDSDLGRAFRYALNELSAFTLISSDASINATIYDAVDNDGDLAVDYRSEQFLAARSELLAALLARNEDDIADIDTVESVITDKVLQDVGQDIRISFRESQNESFAEQIRFGAEDPDLLEGGRRSDQLFGLAGADTLLGHDGNDYLEGNTGNDVLVGGSGKDTLVGGNEDDTLFGGFFINNAHLDDMDEDILRGGAGNDTYHVGLNDVIEDSDGQGSILIEGEPVPLSNITLVSGSNKLFTNNNNESPVRFKQLPDGTLQVIGSFFTIQDFENGDFGINLDGTAPTPDLNLINGSVEDDVITGTAPDGNTGTTGNDEIHGLAGNDTIDGNGGDDVVFGEDGNDVLATANGHDVLDGGAGRDVLRSGAGKDVLLGGSGENFLSVAEDDDFLEGGIDNDYLAGGAGVDALFGGDGNDILWGDATLAPLDRNWTVRVTDTQPGSPGGKSISFSGSIFGDVTSSDDRGDLLDGGPGDDILLGGGGNDQLYGGAGQDDMEGEAGDDRLEGGSGDDALFGDSSTDDGIIGNDILSGGDGNDSIVGGLGDDTIEGGAGNDVIFGDLSPSTGAGGADTIDGNDGDDIIFGGGGDDVITGGRGQDQISGNDGNDTIDGGDEDDTVSGNAGNDTLLGGDGNDTLSGGDGNDVIEGGDGVDTIVGGLGDDEIRAGSGNDTNVQGNKGNDVIYGEAGNDALFGQDGDDQLFGGTGNDQLVGGEGLDILNGEAGDDILFGEAGDDILDGGDGSDELQGGDGDDTLSGGVGVDFIFGHTGDDSLEGGDGDDILVGGIGNDSLVGGSGNDDLNGGDGIDILSGGAGSDDLSGGNDADILSGNAGDDMLDGGTGIDTLYGGSGTDTLVGGFNNDMYLFNIGDGIDTIIEQGDTVGDYLKFGADLDAGNTFLNRDGSNLLVSNSIDLNDKVIIQDWFLDAAHKLDRIEFNDGTMWNQEFINANLNTAPVASADSIDVNEDESTIISASTLLANDTDPENHALAINDVSDAVNGTVLLNQNGDVVFTSDPDYNGPASFTYTIRDDHNGISDIATVDVNVLPVNDAPVAATDAATIKLDPDGGTILPRAVVQLSDSDAVDTFIPPKVARLGNDNVVAVWQGYNLDENGGVDIAYQLFDPSGNPLGEQRFMNINDSGSNTWPSVAAFGNDGFIIVWETVPNTSDDREVVGQLFDPNGDKVGNEFRINTETTHDQTFADAIPLADSGIMATWITFSDTSSTTYTLAGQRYDDTGNAVGGEIDLGVPIHQTLLDKNYDAAGFSTGGFVIAAHGTAYTFDPAGNQQSSTSYSTQTGTPSVDILEDGRFVVTWEDAGFRGQLFNTDGSIAGPEFMIDSSEADISVTALDNGGFIVSWFDDDGNNDLTAQRYDADANPVGGPLLVNDSNKPFFDFADLEGLADGGFMAVWTNINDAGNNNDNTVEARVYNVIDETNGLSLTLDLLANDTDVDNGDGPDNFTLDSVSLQGSDGTVSIVNNQLRFESTFNFASLAVGEEKDFIVDYSMSDEAGLTSTATATISVIGGNDAPEVANPISDQDTDEDTPFSFTVPENAFTDPDNGDNLSFNATLSDDNPLPAWLNFDELTRSFSGTPENGDVGSLNITVTATDNLGASVSDSFALTVNNINDAPVAEPDNATLVLSESSKTREVLVGGEEFKINTTEAERVTSFDSVRLLNGNSVVVWGSADNRIAFQRFDTKGIAIGNQVLVETNPNTEFLQPDVAALSDGGFIVTFTTSDSSTGDTSGQGVAGQKFDANGNTTGTEFLINSEVTDDQRFSTVTALSNGGFVATYRTIDLDISPHEIIKGQLFDAQGNKSGTEFVVDSDLTDNDRNQQVASFTEGGFVVTWVSGFELKTQVFDNSGAKVGNTIIMDNVLTPASVTVLPDENFVLGWIENGMVKNRIYNDEGVAVSEEITLPHDHIGSSINASTLSDGSYIATYTEIETVSTGNNQYMYMQRFDTSGKLIGDKVLVDMIQAGETTAHSGVKITETSNGILTTWGVFDGNILNFDTNYFGKTFTFQTETTGDSIKLDVLANDTDIDMDDNPENFTLNSVTLLGSKGRVKIVDNQLQFNTLGDFVPLSEGETEDVLVDYTMSDSEGAASSSSATITVVGINDAPLISDPVDDQLFNAGHEFAFTVPDDLFIEPDNDDSLAIAASSNGNTLPSWLNFETQSMSFHGMPGEDDYGTYIIELTASDTGGLSVTDTFKLTVNAVPVAAPDTFIAGSDTLFTIPASELLTNDTDADGDILTVTAVDNAVNSTVELDASGDVLFSPDPGFTGVAAFDYTVSDSKSGFSKGNVIIEVFNSVYGGSGDDVLTGTAGDDLFSGGSGNDILIGDEGDDIYRFSRGDGNDVIIEDANTATGGDLLLFSDDIAFADVRILRDKKDLVFTIKDSGDSITLQDWVSKGSAYPLNVEFGDGTNLGLADLDVRERVSRVGNPTVRGFRFDDRLYGDDRDNPVIGKDGDDVLDGGLGNDILEGMSGNDLYQFTAGWGSDIVIENDLEHDPSTGNTDTVAWGSGITPLDLMFHQDGDDLVISRIGTSDDITIQNWYQGSEFQTEIFRASNGKELLNNQVDQLIQAMASFSAETGLDWDTASQQKPEEVEAILAVSWQ